MKSRWLCVGLVILTICTVASTPARSQGNGRNVSWEPTMLAISVFPGTAQVVMVKLAVQRTINDASFFVVPELAPFLRISSSGVTTVFAGQPYFLPVVVEIAAQMNIGTFEGTIHVRQGNRTIPDTLKVLLNIVNASNSVVPTTVSTPSSDRMTTDGDGQELVRDEIVVILDFNTVNPSQRIAQIASSTGAVILGSIPETLTYQLQYSVNDLQALENIRLSLLTMANVVAASHNYLADVSAAVYPNDTRYHDRWDETNPAGDNWNLEYIKAPSAWDITTGSSDVAVAVIDHDFDKNHPDLKNNVTFSTDASIKTILNRSTIQGHGTHVAGTICAEGNNNQGITGVAWKCSLRLYDFSYPPGTSAERAMVSAVNDGAKIVNMSLQFVDNGLCIPGTAKTLQRVKEINDILRRAILYAERQNKEVLWVFAAGNECRDAKYASPASLTKDFPLNTIAVAAINDIRRADGAGNLSPFSNFGELVTVAAPGGDLSTGRGVLSTCPVWVCPDLYGEKIGTSQAAPHVSGLAALVLSKHPNFTASQIKQCIVTASELNGTTIPGYSFKVINAPEAVKCESTNVVVVSHDEGSPDTAFAGGAFFTAPQNAALQSITVYLHVATGAENTDTQGTLRDEFGQRLYCATDVRSATAWGAISGDNQGHLTTVGPFYGTQCNLIQGRNYTVGVGSTNLFANAIGWGGYSGDSTEFYQIRLAASAAVEPLSTVKVTPNITNSKFLSIPCSALPDAAAGHEWTWALSDHLVDPFNYPPTYGGGSQGAKTCADNDFILDLSNSGIPANTDFYLVIWSFGGLDFQIVDQHTIYYAVVHWDGSSASVK